MIGDTNAIWDYFKPSLSYYGTVSLSSSRWNAKGGVIGNKVLFTGGQTGSSSFSSVIDIFDSNLTRTTNRYLNSDAEFCSNGNVGNYLIYAGGVNYPRSVNAYDSSLVRTSCTDLSINMRGWVDSSPHTKDYLILGGAYVDSAPSANYSSTIVNAYSSSLVRLIPEGFAQEKRNMGMGSFNGYVFFAGGYNVHEQYISEIDVYDNSLTRTNIGSLSIPRSSANASIIGDKIIFGGGQTGNSSYSDVVDAIDSSFTRTTISSLSIARISLTHPVALADRFSLYCGGFNSNSSYYSTVDIYNRSLTRSTGTPLPVAQYRPSVCTLDKFLLCGGDRVSYSTGTTTVAVYTI